MKVKKWKDKKGFTLVELVIALGVASIIIGSCYTLIVYGIRTYDLGTKNYNVQSHVRVAAEVIEKEIRYVKEVELMYSEDIDKLTEKEVKTYSYIYLNQDHQIMKLNEAEETKLIEETFDALYFQPVREKGIHFYIRGRLEGDLFEVERTMYPMNLRNTIKKSGPKDENGSGYDAIKYRR